LQCQGLVDLDVEIAKCEKKLDLARMTLEKVRKVEAQPDYEDTVPENVRIANEEKVGHFVGLVLSFELTVGGDSGGQQKRRFRRWSCRGIYLRS
jgi:valyl-tRNA synthetase